MANDQQKNDFVRIIERVEERKLKARRKPKRSIWLGLGLMGMVGWSVAVPTVGGVALGIWLDRIYPQSFSWTLTMLIGGLMFGCLMAYNWIKKETDSIDEKDDDENQNQDT